MRFALESGEEHRDAILLEAELVDEEGQVAA